MAKFVSLDNLSAFKTKLNDIFQSKANLTTTISDSSTDTQYPSAKAVNDKLKSSGGSEITIVRW